MSLLDRFIHRLFNLPPDYGKQLGEVGVSQANTWLAQLLQGEGPPRRGTKELLEAYGKLPWLRATTNRIASSIASVPWQLYVARGREGRAMRRRDLQHADPVTRRKAIKRLKQAGVLEQIERHPFLDLLDNANPEMTGLSARKVTQIWLDLDGTGYWVLERNAFGMPVEYWPIAPHWVTRLPTPDRPAFEVSMPGWRGDVPVTEMVFFRDPDPENPYGRGVGTGEALADELDTDEYAAKHTKAWFYNRASPDLLVGVKGAQKDQLERVKEKWMEDHRGFHKAYRPYFFPAETMTVQEVSQTFADQQLIELRRFERDIAIHVFGIPPEVLGVIENSNRATIDSADYIFAKWVLVPRLEFLRSEMQERLVPLFDERLILDYESPVPEDREFRLKVAQAAPWSVSRDEWRELGLWEPDEATPNVYMVPVNLIPRPVGQPLEAPVPEPPDEEPAEDDEEPEEDEEETRAWQRKQLSEEDITNPLEALRAEHLNFELDPVFRELVAAWGAAMLEELGVEVSFSMTNPLITEYLDQLAGDKVRGINETTKAALRETLVEGVRAGEDIPTLARRVERVFADAKGFRSVTIARTEVVGASNRARYSAMKQSGVVNVTRWLATRDGRTRDTHLAMDGQTRPVGQPFTSPSGYTALHPGDFGVASEDINCRCVTVPVIEEPKDYEPEQLDTLWRTFDRELVPWERTVEEAARRAFEAQEQEVLAALRAMERG